MNKDVWSNILRQWEPKYDELTLIHDGKIPIKAFKNFDKNKYIVNVRHDLEQLKLFEDDITLDEVISWCTSELEKWQGVRRISYDMWKFPKKHDAEKFITLYNLKWAK